MCVHIQCIYVYTGYPRKLQGTRGSFLFEITLSYVRQNMQDVKQLRVCVSMCNVHISVSHTVETLVKGVGRLLLCVSF